MDGQLGPQEASQFDSGQDNHNPPSKEYHWMDENRFRVDFFIEAEALKECAAPVFVAVFLKSIGVQASEHHEDQREDNQKNQEDQAESV